MASKILIFGTGSVGSIYTHLLTLAGAQTTAICRSNFAAVSASGIHIKSAKWGSVSSRPTHVESSISAALAHGPFDYVFVCSKAFSGTVQLIAEAVTPGHTTIVLAQNGIGIEKEYAERYGGQGNAIISGVVWLPAAMYEPGVVVHSYTLQKLELGTYPAEAGPEAKAKVDELVQLFTAADATANHCSDVQRERWLKIAVNASMNPVAALTMCDDANLFRSSERALGLIKDIQMEVGRVAEAAGYEGLVTEEGIEEQMKMYTERMTGGGKDPSMLVDIVNDRPIEVEAILGNLVRIAEGLKVSVPLLSMLYTLACARNLAVVKDERWKPVNKMA